MVMNKECATVELVILFLKYMTVIKVLDLCR